MGLRATHLGYAYQDLLAAIRLVDVALGRAARVIVDEKAFTGDRFDDITTDWRDGSRERLQVKHAESSRDLTEASFAGDGRGLRLDLLVSIVTRDLADHPGTSYRVVMRDDGPGDLDLAKVLLAAGPADPGPTFPGLGGARWRFDAGLLRAADPWRTMLAGTGEQDLSNACRALVIETGLPGCSLDIRAPGPAERILLQRAAEELGAGRPPNRHREPEDVALALIQAAQAARSVPGAAAVTNRDLIPRLDLAVDFGAVHEGHPVDRASEIARPGVLTLAAEAVGRAAAQGGTVVLSGGPGSGKSWLCEQLSTWLRDDGAVVARHHCWLGPDDVNRDSRVLAQVVIGSLLRQLEDAAPAAVAEIRPRYAATAGTLAAAVAAILREQPGRRVVLIVDGLDHVTRVLGRSAGAAFVTPTDPAGTLASELAELPLPAGAVLLLASQPGPHLGAVTPASPACLVTVPPLTRREVRTLADRLGVLAEFDRTRAGPAADGRAAKVVSLIHDMSRGNALYATYLCRQAAGPSPDLSGWFPADPLDRLLDVPASARDLDDYYGYLLAGLSDGQRAAVTLLAVCDFAVTADELGEIFPETAPFLGAALAAVSPVIARQPGIGGLKIHHESFSRFTRDRACGGAEWVARIQWKAADWLGRRGFFTDARAFRQLPGLLAALGRDDELRSLIGPDFLSRAIAGFQPPTAILHALAVAAQHSAARGDWPTLIRCVELRRAADTYSDESISGTILTSSETLVSLLGAGQVAASLVYDGIPTVPVEPGLQLCEAIDLAGTAAPWDAYLTALDDDSGDQAGGRNFLAELRGRLRLSPRAADDAAGGPAAAERIALFFGQEGLPDLPGAARVLADCLGTSALLEAVPLLGDIAREAVLMCLACVQARNGQHLLSSRTLAAAAWACAAEPDLRRLLQCGLPAADLAGGVPGGDPETALRTATEDLLRDPAAGGTARDPDSGLAGAVRRWLGLLAVAHEQDPHAASRLLPLLEGSGFFRAWLRFAVATAGLGRDVARGRLAPMAASAIVRIACDSLARAVQPPDGKPGAVGVWGIQKFVHEVVQAAVALILPEDLEPAVASLSAVSDGTTMSVMGMAGSGPLITTDLLAILSRTTDQAGAAAVRRMMRRMRAEHEIRDSTYPENATFELEMARISLCAADPAEARLCWERAALYMAAYGSHKDITIYELLDPLPALAAADSGPARARLARLQPLAYLAAQTTDGTGPTRAPRDWWCRLADLDPRAAADLGADALLSEPGLPNGLVDAAHQQLLGGLADSADPVVLAVLRITAGPSGRDPGRDAALLGRLAALPADDPARTAGILPLLANAITAVYDDQPLISSHEDDGPEPTAALRDASQVLGGEGATPRPPRASGSKHADWRPTAPGIPAFLHAQQRPGLPSGPAAGAVAAVRDQASRPYDADPGAPRWSGDALANAAGWRLIQAAVDEGADAATALLRRLAEEAGDYGPDTVLADIASGLELRRDLAPGDLGRLPPSPTRWRSRGSGEAAGSRSPDGIGSTCGSGPGAWILEPPRAASPNRQPRPSRAGSTARSA